MAAYLFQYKEEQKLQEQRYDSLFCKLANTNRTIYRQQIRNTVNISIMSDLAIQEKILSNAEKIDIALKLMLSKEVIIKDKKSVYSSVAILIALTLMLGEELSNRNACIEGLTIKRVKGPEELAKVPQLHPDVLTRFSN